MEQTLSSAPPYCISFIDDESVITYGIHGNFMFFSHIGGFKLFEKEA